MTSAPYQTSPAHLWRYRVGYELTMGATVTRPLASPEIALEPRQSHARRMMLAIAGPALIVAGVLFALRGFAFGGRLTQAHPDILTFWLPRFSFLGRSLASGHVPLWNPFEMAGSRYAADPQGGWLYVTPMALFTAMSPAAAMRAFIVVNPVLAGIGMHAFLRIQRLARLAATLGGLSLAMLMSTSEIAISMPFAGATAWTMVTLVGAAGFLRADRWPRRLAWIGLGALGWSQVATAHLSHGLVICTILVVAFLTTGVVADRGRTQLVPAAGHALAFVTALPVLSLAVLIPRMQAVRGSSLAAGYDRLGDALGTLGGGGEAIQTNGVWAGWPFAFGMTPGAYAGAVILLGVPLALRARRFRPLVWAFGGAVAVTWFGMLDAVVTNSLVRAVVLKIPFGDVYLHNPGRLRYLAVVAVPVLGAVGIQGLRDDPLDARRATRWLAGGAVLWLGVPLAMRASPVHLVFLAAALVASGVAVHAFATRRYEWAWVAVACVLTLELAGSAVWSHGHDLRRHRPYGARRRRAPQPGAATTAAAGGRCVGVHDTRPRSYPGSWRPDRPTSRGLRPPRTSRRGTCSCRPSRIGRRSRWNVARCSASATSWATTRCSSPATGTTCERAPSCPSSTTRPCRSAHRARRRAAGRALHDRADRPRRRHSRVRSSIAPRATTWWSSDGWTTRASVVTTWTVADSHRRRPRRRYCQPGSILRRVAVLEADPGLAPETGRAAGRWRP